MTTTKWRRIQWLATWIVSHTEDSLRMALQWIDLLDSILSSSSPVPVDDPTGAFISFFWRWAYGRLSSSKDVESSTTGLGSKVGEASSFCSPLSLISSNSRVRHRKKQFQINVSWKGVDRWNEALQNDSTCYVFLQIQILSMILFLSP